MSKFVLFGLLLVAIAANADVPYKAGPPPKGEESKMGAEKYEVPPPPPPPYEIQTQMGSSQYNVPPYGAAYPKPEIVYCNPKVDLTHLPGNCHKFRRCSNGILYIMACPDNLVFDDVLKVCNYKQNVLPPCGTAKQVTTYGTTNYGAPYNVPSMPEAQPGSYNVY